MEQMQTGILELLTLTAAQTLAKTQPKAPAKDGETSDFRKLMDQTAKGEEQAPAVAGQTTQTQQADQKPAEDQPQTDVLTQQRQMELAAALTMQAPAAQEMVIIPEEAPAEVPVTESVQLAEAAIPQAEAPVMQDQGPAEQAEAVPMEAPAAERQIQDIPEEAPVQQAQPRQAAQAEAPAERPVSRVQREDAVEAPQEEEEAVPVEAPQEPEPVFHEADATYVKVGETASTEEAKEDAPVEKQVAVRLEQALENGESKVQLNLTPANLGSVQVEITRRADGVLQVVLTAQKASTQTLLEKHAAGLQAMVANRSQESVTVQVERREDAQSYDGHNGHQEQQNPQQRREPQRDRENSHDFLQQLRLGLVPLEAE